MMYDKHVQANVMQPQHTRPLNPPVAWKANGQKPTRTNPHIFEKFKAHKVFSKPLMKSSALELHLLIG